MVKGGVPVRIWNIASLGLVCEFGGWVVRTMLYMFFFMLRGAQTLLYLAPILYHSHQVIDM